jgi:uncharacterized protein
MPDQPSTAPLDDHDLARLQTLLDELPPPLQPLDVSALDGYLCGVLLQPQRVPESRWLPHVADIDGRPAPHSPALQELHALTRRRHAELESAIGERQWFDPWIYPPADDEDGSSPSDTVLPWVAGFATATSLFPALTDHPHPDLVEPLALLFMHVDPDDLEDADALVEVIQTLEPPKDLAEAVQDVVRALMLMADVTRPRQQPQLQPQSRPAAAPRKPARRSPPPRRLR